LEKAQYATSLKRGASVDKNSPKKICIDDFALKRRHRYGTVMIDIETRRIIDILESREAAEVTQWLKTYPNIEVASRDGSSQYETAIRQAHPDAIQVSDRFHLIKNLTDYVKKHISQIVPANFFIMAENGGDTADNSGGYWEKPELHGPDLPERRHNASTEKKKCLVEKVRELAREGLSINEIAAETGVNRKTASKYLDENFDPANKGYGAKQPSKLKPYTNKIDTMLNERYKLKDIEDAIRGLGYDGGSSTIRMYASRQRKIKKSARADEKKGTELIERKWVTKLLYKPIDQIKELTESQVERIVREYPVIGNLYDIVQSFKEIMFAKRVDELETWMETARQLEIDGIDSFINGIAADLDAVKNAIRFEYNNGLAEGSVNKLKVIKRIMYGRCSFQALRSKVLLLEQNRVFN
jgi:transposase